MPEAEPRRPPRGAAPLQQRRVQVSLAALASILLIGLLLSAPGEPAQRRTIHSAATKAKSSSGTAAPLKIDLNRAEARELALLPGVGPVLAGRIVRHRERHGRFETIAALEQVRGIGPKTIAALAPLCVLGDRGDHEPAGRSGAYVTNAAAPAENEAPPASASQSDAGAAASIPASR